MPFNKTAADIKPEGKAHMVALEHVSISHLFGRDYVFLDTHYEKTAFSTPEKTINTINYLIAELNLLGHSTLFVGVNSAVEDDPIFCRQEITWNHRTIASLEAIVASSEEQKDFMKMIWQCSTPPRE